MTKEVKSIAPDASLKEAAKLMRQMEIGAAPVTLNGRAVGMVTDRDLVVRAIASGCDPHLTTVREVMTYDLVELNQDDSLDDAITTMMEKRVGRILVTDSDRQLVGILSTSDAAIYSESGWEVSALATQLARRDRSRKSETTIA